MVPHIPVEEKLAELIGAGAESSEGDDEEGHLQVAVTAVPDEKRGERLVVLHRKLDIPTEELLRGLSEAGLPNIYLPNKDCFIEVDEIPILGSGKLDLKGIHDLALERMG